MVARSTPPQSWRVTVAGAPHHIVLLSGGHDFTVDGVLYGLGGTFHRGPRTAAFNLAGHEASVTLRLVAPSFMSSLRRSLRDSARRLPLILPAWIVGGAGLGGGVAAGLTNVQWAWAIYELRLDGKSQGSWVSTVVGESGSWTYVEPDGALPEPDWLNWPAPRASRS